MQLQSRNEKTVRSVFGHKITHRTQELAPESCRRHGMTISQEQAANEVVADYAGDLINDRNLLEKFVSDNKSNKTLLEKFLDVLRDIAAKLKGSIHRTNVDEAVKLLEKAMGEAAAQVERIESGAGKKTPEGVEINNSKKYNNSKQLSIKKGGKPRAQKGRSIELETMENNRFERLRQFGDELPDKFDAYTNDYYYLYSNHSFTDYTVLVRAKITEANRKYIDYFSEELHNGTYEYSETFDRWVESFRHGKGLYSWNSIRTGKGRTAVQPDGVDVGTQRSDTSGNSGSSGADSTQYSLKDSNGRTLSEKQTEYFKDSKAVDENGNLLAMYHGTRKGPPDK